MGDHIDVLVQERQNFSALAMEFCLSCTKLSIMYDDNLRNPSWNDIKCCIWIESWNQYVQQS